MSLGLSYQPWLQRVPSRVRSAGATGEGSLRWRVSATVAMAMVAAVDMAVLLSVLVIVEPKVSAGTALAFAGTVLVVLGGTGHYRTRITLSVAREGASMVGCLAVSVLLLSVVHARAAWAGPLLHAAVFAAVPLLAARGVTYTVLRGARHRGFFSSRTLIIGAGQVATQFASTLQEHPEYGLRPIGFLDDVDGSGLPLPLLGGVDRLGPILAEHAVKRVVMAFGVTREAAVVDVVRACSHAAVEVYVLPRFFELGFAAQGKYVDDVWGFPLFRLPRAALRSYAWGMKRVFDVAVSGVGLLLLSPVYGILALAVKVSSPGPVYFRQVRIGQRGFEVEVLKFRSMRVNNDSDTKWDVSADDRVTKLGSILRKTSLDELPQLWNVLKGDMSLVGPRPERPFFVERFNTEVPRYDQRHRVPAGLTGLAQVNGFRGDTSIGERARFDNHYIDNWSLWHDIVILFQTIGAVFKQMRQ